MKTPSYPMASHLRDWVWWWDQPRQQASYENSQCANILGLFEQHVRGWALGEGEGAGPPQMNIWRENISITAASLWSSSLWKLTEWVVAGSIPKSQRVLKQQRTQKGTAYGSDDHTETSVPFPAEAVKRSLNSVVSKISACVLNTLTLEFVGDT